MHWLPVCVRCYRDDDWLDPALIRYGRCHPGLGLSLWGKSCKFSTLSDISFTLFQSFRKIVWHLSKDDLVMSFHSIFGSKNGKCSKVSKMHTAQFGRKGKKKTLEDVKLHAVKWAISICKLYDYPQKQKKIVFWDAYGVHLFDCPGTEDMLLTRQALRGRRHPQGAGGHKVAPLYFSRNISATRKRRNAKLCTHLPEYLADVVCQFSGGPISDDVTVTSEVRS